MLGLRCCRDFSLVAASGGYSLVVECGLFTVVAVLTGSRALVAVAGGRSSLGSWALEHRLSSCVSQT